MKKPKEKFYSTQESVFYYISRYVETDPVLSSFHYYFNGRYTQRLIEDVSLSIMPIGGKTKRKEFKVNIIPQDQGIQDLIAKGIAQDDYRRSLAGEVCDFFRDCAQSIMAYSEADYEIVYLSRQKGGENIGFKLALIPPLTLIQKKGRFYQYLPKQLAEVKGSPQYIQFSEHSVLRFQAPSPLRNELKYILDSLSSLSDHPALPDFVLQNMGINPNPIPFDIKAFEYSHKLALADAGKPIGWNSFIMPGDQMLEYYWFYRFLLFEQFKISLRNSIISTFNEGLDIVGQKLGIRARLEIEGLPSIEDVNAAQSKLFAGSISFNKLLDEFSLL